jgi:Flp pilus assembly protein TadD
MSRNAALRWTCCWLIAAGLAVAPPAEAKPKSTGAAEQLGFGVDMARRGLWNEALFRFEQAKRLAPDDAKVWNNLAVACEAVGRFDDAHVAYKEAIRLAPTNKNLKRNVARFLEFYQGYKPGAAPPPAKAEAPPQPPKPEAR